MLRLQLMLALFVAIGASSQPTCRGNDGACSAADDVGLMQKPGPSNSQLNRKAQKSTVELLQHHMGASFQGASSVPALSLAMGQLAADVVAGKTVITDATKKALQGIWEEMEAVFTSAKETQAADLELVKAVADAVEACDQPVVGNKDWGKDAASKNTDHNTCRTSEEDLKETMDTECLEYETAGKNPNVPSCLATFPANPSLDEIPSMMACVDKIAAWSAEFKQKLAKEKSECDEASKNHQDKVPVCNQAQSTYESHFCSYHETLTSRCDSYIECRREKGDAQQTTHDAVDVSLASRNSESRAARHIQCFLGVLNATATTQPNLLNGCVSRIESSKDQPAQFEIPTIQEHPALDCDKSPVESKPCDSQWISTYEAQPWFQKSPTVACSECAHLQVSETPTTSTLAQDSHSLACDSVGFVMGRHHQCLLPEEGDIKCWQPGQSDRATIDVPSGLNGKTVRSLVAGVSINCALLVTGKIQCWGPPSQIQDLSLPDGLPEMKSIQLTTASLCGVLASDSTVRCYGKNKYGETHVPQDLGPVRLLAAGGLHVCAVAASDGTIRCWGGKSADNIGCTDAPQDVGDVKELASNRYSTCALLKNGSLRCWGYSTYYTNAGQQDAMPTDLPKVRHVFGGGYRMCAILDADGSVRCWGLSKTAGVQNTNLPAVVGAGQFAELSIGGHQSCAVLLDKETFHCWGYAISVPTGDFDSCKYLHGAESAVEGIGHSQHVVCKLKSQELGFDGRSHCGAVGNYGNFWNSAEA